MARNYGTGNTELTQSGKPGKLQKIYVNRDGEARRLITNKTPEKGSGGRRDDLHTFITKEIGLVIELLKPTCSWNFCFLRAERRQVSMRHVISIARTAVVPTYILASDRS